MGELAFGGAAGVIVLVAYAVIMLLIGYFVGRGGRDDLKSHYLAGGNLGVIVLFFTLYATQYSGNTVIGYPAQAYREGFPWWQSVTFFTLIIAGYLLFAPRMYVLAKKHSFVTPVDWLRHRFDSRGLSLLATFLMLWGLANYLLEQLIAMGHAIAGLTGETVPYQLGVLAFVCVMLVYSWSGGMRAVALTDVMQGVALLIGVVALLVGAFVLTGESPSDTARYLVANEPEAMAVPSLRGSINWLSMMLMVAIGIALYPHAIQRVFAARSERTLKRSLLPMVWMPLVTAGVVWCIGMVGIRLFPGLSDSESERLVGMIANEVAGLNVVFYVAMILLFGGVVAAIVSTADSALLSLSSIVSRDVYARHVRPDAPERRQLLVGKLVGGVVVFGLLLLAWNPPGTLVNIFVLKIELLIQLAPAFVLGMYWPRLRARPVCWGMGAGAVLAGGMTLAGTEAIYGVHGGMIGLLLNLLICVVGSLLPSRGPDDVEEADPSARART